jgi:membrane protein required for colicin V production
MTVYDAAMAGVVILGMIWGAWRGITWQVASIASLVVGYLVAHPTSAQIAHYFPGEPVVARALAMLAVYVGVSGGIFLTAWVIRSTLRRMKFEAYDRHLGMVLGGLEGAFLGVVATLFVVSFAPETRDPIFASPSGKLVGRVMAAVGPVLPDEVRKVLTPFWSDSPPSSMADRRHGWEGSIPEIPLEKRRDDGQPKFREELSDLGRKAGKAVRDSIEDGSTSDFGGLIEQGREQLGRAAQQAVEDQMDRMGRTNHGRDRDARRR